MTNIFTQGCATSNKIISRLTYNSRFFCSQIRSLNYQISVIYFYPMNLRKLLLFIAIFVWAQMATKINSLFHTEWLFPDKAIEVYQLQTKRISSKI